MHYANSTSKLAVVVWCVLCAACGSRAIDTEDPSWKPQGPIPVVIDPKVPKVVVNEPIGGATSLSLAVVYGEPVYGYLKGGRPTVFRKGVEYGLPGPLPASTTFAIAADSDGVIHSVWDDDGDIVYGRFNEDQFDVVRTVASGTEARLPSIAFHPEYYDGQSYLAIAFIEDQPVEQSFTETVHVMTVEAPLKPGNLTVPEFHSGLPLSYAWGDGGIERKAYLERLTLTVKDHGHRRVAVTWFDEQTNQQRVSIYREESGEFWETYTLPGSIDTQVTPLLFSQGDNDIKIVYAKSGVLWTALIKPFWSGIPLKEHSLELAKPLQIAGGMRDDGSTTLVVSTAQGIQVLRHDFESGVTPVVHHDVSGTVELSSTAFVTPQGGLHAAYLLTKDGQVSLVSL